MEGISLKIIIGQSIQKIIEDVPVQIFHIELSMIEWY